MFVAEVSHGYSSPIASPANILISSLKSIHGKNVAVEIDLLFITVLSIVSPTRIGIFDATTEDPPSSVGRLTTSFIVSV